jgi:hypothetical protein
VGPAPFVSEVMHAAPQVYWGPTIRARQMKSDLIGVSGKGLRRGGGNATASMGFPRQPMTTFTVPRA